MKLDLHVHSFYSDDGLERIDRIIKTAISRGLEGIAVCDHNRFEAYEEAKRLAPDGFVIIPGVEYSTDAGHVLALFVTREYELQTNANGARSLADLRRKADADGALLIAAHPFRKRTTLPDFLLQYVDGVEAENSRDVAKTPGNSAKARDTAKKHSKFITGGSDAHILREIGCCYTILPDDTEKTPDGVKRALLSGKSEAGGEGGTLRYQAISKLRNTKPRTFLKDIARLIVFTAKDVTG